jgi:CheY-like chemotaxis protein
MVVDDDEDIRELLKVFLEAEGYGVTLAADGLEALQQIQTQKPPGLILLDLMMPQMDGEKFLKALGATPFAEIPVIILSGHTSAQDAASKLSATCLMKPVELNDLLSMVRTVMAAYSPRDAA